MGVFGEQSPQGQKDQAQMWFWSSKLRQVNTAVQDCFMICIYVLILFVKMGEAPMGQAQILKAISAPCVFHLDPGVG